MEEKKLMEQEVQDRLQQELQKEELRQEKELRKEWEDQEFQDKHALARELARGEPPNEM